jgi:hypothetical protein
MKTVTLLNGERFILNSFGNGLSYLLSDKLTGMEYFSQGDDADFFRGDLASVERRNPDYSPDQVCMVLWDLYDYGSAASPAGRSHC